MVLNFRLSVPTIISNDISPTNAASSPNSVFFCAHLMPREARKNHQQALGLHKIVSLVTKIHIFMQTILDSIDKSQNQLDKNSIVGEIPLLNAYITKESAPCGALSSFLISDIVYRITLLLRIQHPGCHPCCLEHQCCNRRCSHLVGSLQHRVEHLFVGTFERWLLGMPCSILR